MLWRRFFVTFPLLAACSGAQPVRKRHPDYSDRDLNRLERKLFDAVNERRKQAKVLPLVWSDLLASEARRHSTAMLEGGFFGHRDPVRGDLDRRLKERAAKLLWRRIAENIHQQRGAEDPVSAAVESWMESPGHRKNVLDGSFNGSGVGSAVAQDGTHYTTQIFALLLPAEE
jgi:uncharacterized protein YkwD